MMKYDSPYKLLPIYSPSMILKFRQLSAKREPLPPHVFSIADFAFTNMEAENTNQSVVISGESGSGKSEATKLILQYLAECSGHGGQVEEQILEANPIMEAFGNAKTVRNNNSSRFGKWIKIDFMHQKISGAHIESYLLEKTRVVTQSPGERNYHVFYQLCAGASDDEKREFGLSSATNFKYCSGGNAVVLEGVHDDREFKLLRKAMDTLNFPKEVQIEIFKILASILHLGNLEFKMKNDEESCVANLDRLEIIAKLMRIDPAMLQNSLITRRIKVVNELVVAFNNKSQAEDGRDALSKYLYDKLFEYLIFRINKTLSTGNPSQAFIGVLDIFGFEIFETNRFEQLCINFANEKLQQHFNYHIFSMEQEEYKNDGINVAHVEFVDNQACLDVIEKRPAGIFSMVDEELRLPKGSDANLLTRMHKDYERNKYYVKPRTAKPVFSICHYAGEVTYVIEGFLDKNRDTLSDDVLNAIRSSKCSLIAELSLPSSGGKNFLHSSTFSSKTLSKPIGSSSVSSQFKEQLGGLMKTLNSTNPQFVRCIKPNELKLPDSFNANFVMRQLRYLGIKEVVNIRQLGYPIRKLHQEFLIRYKMFSQVASNPTNQITLMLKEMGVSPSQYQLGRTKVFFKNSAITIMEQLREKIIVKLVIKLQAVMRRWFHRKRFLRMKKVLDTLKGAISSPEDHVEELESGLALAKDMGISTPLIAQAWNVLQQAKEVMQVKKGLTAAIASKDVTVIKAAISRAAEMKIDAKIPLLVQAEQLVQHIEAHNKSLSAASKARDLQAVKAALAVADRLGLARDIEKQAMSLVTRLEAEWKVKANVEAAMQARDLARLKIAIGGAVDIGYDFPALVEAKNLLQSLEDQRKVAESLQAAIQSQSAGLIERSVQEAKKIKSNQVIDELLAKCNFLLGTLKIQAKEQEIASSLKAAMECCDMALLDAAIKRTLEAKIQSPLLEQAQIMYKKLGAEMDVEDRLSKALHARSLPMLEKAVADAKANDSTNSASYPRAVALLQTLQRIFGAINAAIKQNALDALEKALNDALQAGLESTELVKNATKQRHQLVEQKSVLLSLENAIGSGNVALLKNLIDRAKTSGLTSSNAIVAKAQAEYSRIIASKTDAASKARLSVTPIVAGEIVVNAEQKVDDDVVMPMRSMTRFRGESVENHQERVRKSTVGFNLPPQNIRALPTKTRVTKRSSQYFNAATYMDEKYALALFPKLKTEEDYVSGRLFGRSALKATMLSWNKEVIPNALTQMQLDLETDCLSIFKSILGFMGDRHYAFPDTLASEVLDRGLRKESLRDEIYVQLMKQLTFNGKPESLVRGWQFLGLACETFMPSMVLLPFLLHFIKDHIDNEVGGIFVPMRKEYAHYCMKTLLKTFSSPPRSEAPTIEHVTAFQTRVMLSGFVNIYFLDGSYIEMQVDPTTLAKQVVEIVAEELELHDTKGFAIFEVEKNRTDRYIQPNECLLDFDAYKSKDGLKRFLFRKRIFNTMKMPISNDPIHNALVYHQGAFDIFSGNLTLDVETTVHLYAINASLEADKQLSYVTHLVDEKSHFIPKVSGMIPSWLKMSGKLGQSVFTEKLKAKQATLVDISIDSYLRLLFAQPQFGCQFFDVQQDENPHFPEHMLLGVNRNGFSFINWETKGLVGQYTFDTISGWTDTPLLFVTRFFDKKGGKLETLCLHTVQGKMITNVLQDYVAMLLAEMKNPPPSSGLQTKK